MMSEASVDVSSLSDGPKVTPAPFVSIVMCAFGVEAFISDAIADIEAQTDPDWELIVVDDASPDASADIARAAASADSRIRIVSHAENRGASAARNTGIAAARGAYVWIPDPDDRYDRDTIASVRASLGVNDADIVVFGTVEEYRDQDGALFRSNLIVPEARTCRDAAAVRREVLPLEVQTLLGYSNNKFVRRGLLRGLSYREGLSLCEDFFMSIDLVDRATSMNVLDIAPYHYNKRISGSLTGRFVADYYPIHLERIESLRDHLASWDMLDDEARATIGGLYARYVVSALERTYDPRSGMDRTARVAWCRRVVDDGPYRDLVDSARSQGSRSLALAVCILRTRVPALMCAMGRAAHAAKLHAFGTFSKVKSER